MHVFLHRSALCFLAGLAATILAAQDAAHYRSAEDGGPRRWEVAGPAVELRADPSGSGAVTGEVPEGAILTNLGCKHIAGQDWCEVRPFRGGGRGFVNARHLRPAKAPDGTIPMGVNDSRHRARTCDFDARGDIACAQERGQTLGTCAAGVARSGGGDATVVVTFQNGFARRLFFENGEFISASATMSGAGRDVDWRVEGGVHHLRVDDQRYELPDALVFGE